MTAALDAIDAALQEVTTARLMISKTRSKQVRNADHLASLRSLSYAWFNGHKKSVVSVASDDLGQIDDAFQTILNSTDRSAARSTYLGALTRAKSSLIAVRSAILKEQTSVVPSSDDALPDFSPLAGNLQVRDVLGDRWVECQKCVSAGAHLAAIVMMGGLLEALFVARANKMEDKSVLVKAKAAPINKGTGKALDYRDWMLDSYIKVGHELGWITESAATSSGCLERISKLRPSCKAAEAWSGASAQRLCDVLECYENTGTAATGQRGLERRVVKRPCASSPVIRACHSSLGVAVSSRAKACSTSAQSADVHLLAYLLTTPCCSPSPSPRRDTRCRPFP